MASADTRLLRLAGPLILSNLTVALQGMVDTAVVGHLETPAYIGAVAVAGVIFSFLYWGMGFLRMGTVGVVAQFFVIPGLTWNPVKTDIPYKEFCCLLDSRFHGNGMGDCTTPTKACPRMS